MKVVILAGGLGTRLSEETGVKPKPMVEIGGHPILWHIMNIYAHYGYKEFVIALGYKGYSIKEYFLNHHAMNSNFSIDLFDGKMKFFDKSCYDWKVTLVDTGELTMTGGRLKRLTPFLENQPFMLTYGDGVSNVNIRKLVEFHESHGKLMTITAVHPKAHYGELEIENNAVLAFKEKPQFKQSWVNGGFMVIQPNCLKYLENDETILEREPMEKFVEDAEMAAYQHNGFWQCMDTLRDMKYLNELWSTGKAPWMIW
ncbi:MAG: glucose-1-phosphate cytidylyltransferase [Desulfamplus sp.]|nr:glucose-1-phosphate cytidylyltransferase [Desulfamplus sp.]